MHIPTILVADDSPLNLDLVTSILTAEGFRTLTAGDGRTARELSLLHAPDLILLDVMMPGESAFETCAQLKSDAATAGIPIIFLSALEDVTSKVEGLKIGGVDYIAKPVHDEELLARPGASDPRERPRGHRSEKGPAARVARCAKAAASVCAFEGRDAAWKIEQPGAAGNAAAVADLPELMASFERALPMGGFSDGQA